MVSVKADIPEKVLLLREGVDDYMTKPFSFEELLARIQAILRRPQLIQSAILEIDDVTLNTRSQEVTKGGKAVYLTRKEFSLLEYLLKNKGAVISRGTILEHVWNIEGDPFSNSIETHIRNLRKKIDSKLVPLIHNVPGRGYKIDLKK
jgi:DNA-binding response OmpR family regulator